MTTAAKTAMIEAGTARISWPKAGVIRIEAVIETDSGIVYDDAKEFPASEFEFEPAGDIRTTDAIWDEIFWF